MNKLLLLLFAAIALSACTNSKAEKKALTDDVMKIHEKVMNIDGQAMANHMKLDTLVQQNAVPSKDTAMMLNKKLQAADDAMSDWMHKFDYELKGKSDADAVAYMKDQKRRIMAIDSQLNAAVNESNLYLKKIKAK